MSHGAFLYGFHVQVGVCCVSEWLLHANRATEAGAPEAKFCSSIEKLPSFDGMQLDKRRNLHFIPQTWLLLASHIFCQSLLK